MDKLKTITKQIINKIKKSEDKNKLKLFLSLFVLLLLCVGISYALYNAVFIGQREHEISTARVSFSYKEPLESLNMITYKPLSDNEGKAQDNYYEFQVKATSDKPETVNYFIYLQEVTATYSFSKNDIKLYLTEVNDGVETPVVEPTLISDFITISSLSNSKGIYGNTFNLNDSAITKTYRLRIWLKEDFNLANIMQTSINETGEKNFKVNQYEYKFKVNVKTGTMPTINCSIAATPDGVQSSKTLTITGIGSVASSGYSWNGTSYSSTKTKTITDNGIYTAYVKDSSNNVKTCSINITDTLSCTITKSTSGSTTILTINGNNGVISSGYSWDGTTYSSTKTKTITENGTYTAYVKDSNNNIKTCLITINDIIKWKTILSMYQSEDLHIGDFITYDAGTWTQEEIASIKVGPNSSLVSASGSTSLPSTNYQFGGFIAGQSRNVGAIEYNNGTYMYAKMYDGDDSSNQVPLSGWRVFDIDNNYVTLISAANPEDYKHYETGEGYISLYILTGTKNANWSDNVSNYTKRDWRMYENSRYNASNARVLTFKDLNNWYNKYMGVTNASIWTDSTFQRIYSSPYLAYQNLIDNHSYYWLGSALSGDYLYGVYPIRRGVSGGAGEAHGVRVLVSIPLTSTIQENPVARRTVTLNGMGWSSGTYGAKSVQEYNVWDLAVE